MFFKTVLMLILTVCVYAQDVVEVYRKKGPQAAINMIEQELASRDYWLNYLANKDVSLGFYEGNKAILICDKEKPDLTLYSYTNGKLTQLDKIKAIVGGGKGDKVKEGDFKTPTGSYDLLSKLSKLNQFYGPFAYNTDYPNLYDVVNQKNGHGIWLHGLPLNGERATSSKGCMVIDNNALQKLDKEADLKKTVLIIDDQALQKTTKEEIAIIISSMYQWKDAWVKNDLKRYLSFYDIRFKRFDGMDLKKYSEYKTRIFGKKEQKSIYFKEFEVTPNPTSVGERIFKIKFYEDYMAPSYKFSGYKDLFVKVSNGKMTIMAER
jgi:murein L,D-transpeptidase YafK